MLEKHTNMDFLFLWVSYVSYYVSSIQIVIATLVQSTISDIKNKW